MRWHFSARTISVVAMPLIVALTGCHGREDYAYRLNTIPVPQPALLKRLPEPDCPAPADVAPAREGTERSGPGTATRKTAGRKWDDGAQRKAAAADETPEADADRTDERIDPGDATPDASEDSATPAAEPVASEPGDGVDELRRERDCYRRAEKRARTRLRRLQASAAGTIGALREAKRTLGSPMRLHAPSSDAPGRKADRRTLELSRPDDGRR